MIDYKTLERDKNDLPRSRAYYGIILKVALKLDSWTITEMVNKVKEIVPLPPKLSELKTEKGKNTLEYTHIKIGIQDLIEQEAIKHVDRQHYTISNIGKRAYKDHGIQTHIGNVVRAKFDLQDEKWEKLKKENYGKNTILSINLDHISFSKKDWKKVKTGKNELTYDEYIEAQKDTNWSYYHKTRLDGLYFFNNAQGYFEGKIVATTKEYVLFEDLNVGKSKSDKEMGTENYLWMNRNGFQEYLVGDYVAFKAEIFSYLCIRDLGTSKYLKRRYIKEIDYALKNPSQVHKLGHQNKFEDNIHWYESAWNASPYSDEIPFSEIKEEVEKAKYKVEIDYQAKSEFHTEIEPKNVLLSEETDLEKDWYYEQRKVKPVPNTKFYSVFDEKHKLVLKTADYDELKEFLEKL